MMAANPGRRNIGQDGLYAFGDKTLTKFGDKTRENQSPIS